MSNVINVAQDVAIDIKDRDELGNPIAPIVVLRFSDNFEEVFTNAALDAFMFGQSTIKYVWDEGKKEN